MHDWIDHKDESFVNEKPEEVFLMQEMSQETTSYQTKVLPLKEHNSPEVKQAKLDEIEKLKILMLL